MTTRLICELRLDVEPRPAPRPKFARTGVAYSPAWYRDLLVELAWHLTSARVDRRPAIGPVGLDVLFRRSNARRVDLDNLLKTLLDAATGVVWVDDFQLRELRARLEIKTGPGLIWARFVDLAPTISETAGHRDATRSSALDERRSSALESST